MSILQRYESAEVLRHDLGPENEPQRFGGDHEWEFGSFPNLGPDAQFLN